MTVHTGAKFGFQWGFIAGDSGWGNSFNKQAQTIEALLALTLNSDSTLIPPTTPSETESYYVPSGATGAWAANVGKIAVWQDGAWNFYTPPLYLRAWINSRTGFFYFNGAAWTAEVTSSGGGGTGAVTSVAGRTGIVTLTIADIVGGAPLASPPFTGNPTAPTQAALSANTRLANTKYVDDAVAAGGGGGTSGDFLPIAGGVVTPGPLIVGEDFDLNTQLKLNAETNRPREIDFLTMSEMRWKVSLADDETGTGNGGCNFAIDRYDDTGTRIGTSAAFSIARGTGIAAFVATPTHPSPTAGDNSTKSATTAFVQAAMSSAGAISEAPINTLLYGRKDGAWALVPSSGLASGLVTIGTDTLDADASLRLDSIDGHMREIKAQTSGLDRWRIRLASDSEEDPVFPDSGSDFFLDRYNDTGGYIGSPITIERKTGNMQLVGPITLYGDVTQLAGTFNGLVGNLALASDPTQAVTARNKGELLAQWVQGVIVSNGLFYFAFKAPYAGTILSLDSLLANGSFTLDVKINTTGVTGLTGLALSTGSATTNATAARTFAIGDAITGTISVVTSNPTGTVLNLNVKWS